MKIIQIAKSQRQNIRRIDWILLVTGLNMLRKAWNTLLFIWATILGATVGLIACVFILVKERFEAKENVGKQTSIFLANKKRAIIFYKFLSKVYDVVNPFFYDETMRETIVNWAGVREGSLVLDVGCGTGYTTEGILKKLSHGKVVCLDFTRQQLEKAVTKLRERGNTMFLMGDAENLPFKEGTFDAIISAGAVEYFPNPKRAIQEMTKVAKPGRKVVIGGPELRWFKKLLLNRVLYTPSMEELQKFYSEAELKDIKTFLTGVNTFFGTDKYAVIIMGVKAS